MVGHWNWLYSTYEWQVTATFDSNIVCICESTRLNWFRFHFQSESIQHMIWVSMSRLNIWLKLLMHMWIDSTHDSFSFHIVWFDSIHDSFSFHIVWFDSTHDSFSFHIVWFDSTMTQRKMTDSWVDSWFDSESYTTLLRTTVKRTILKKNLLGGCLGATHLRVVLSSCQHCLHIFLIQHPV